MKKIVFMLMFAPPLYARADATAMQLAAIQMCASFESSAAYHAICKTCVESGPKPRFAQCLLDRCTGLTDSTLLRCGDSCTPAAIQDVAVCMSSAVDYALKQR